MIHKFTVLLLTLCLIFSMVGYSFGLTEPEQPTIDESNPAASNELIENYNQQVDKYNAEVDTHNQQVDSDYEEACTVYEEEKTKVEANNTFVDNVESKIDADSSEAHGFENNSAEIVPTDWNDETNEESLKTIQIEKSNNPSGEKIKVINLHVFLDESVPYSPDCYQTSIDRDTFELSDEMKQRAVLTEWETAEIDYNDIVTMISEAAEFAGNIVWLNGKRQWFGADPKPYFFRNIEGYTQGYWMSGGSMMASTATVDEYGWSPGGETYTVQYAEETAYSNYLYNGQRMTEENTVRTTDRQEPKNIFALFTYLFTRLAPEPEKQELPEEPVKGEYLNKLNHLDLLDIPTQKTNPKPTQDTNIITPAVQTTVIKTLNEQPNTPIEITNEPIPKVASQGSWALINLIATILSCICAIVLLFVRKDKEDDEPTNEEKKDMRGMIGTKLASMLIGIISIIVFIFTEDMTLPMVFTDKWTILMILLLIVEIINIFIIRQQSKGEEEDD